MQQDQLVLSLRRKYHTEPVTFCAAYTLQEGAAKATYAEPEG